MIQIYSLRIPTKDIRNNFLGVLKILGVNERFGLGRVLERYPFRSFKIRFYMLRLSIRDIYN
jgi:hypothetical protein